MTPKRIDWAAITVALAAVWACVGALWLFSVYAAPASIPPRPALPSQPRGWTIPLIAPRELAGPPLPAKSFRIVGFDEGAVSEPKLHSLWQRMTNALSEYGRVPRDRLKYYSAMLDGRPHTYELQSWYGVIRGVRPAPFGKGHLVTIEVGPDVDAAAIFDTDYTEQYLVGDDGSVRFVGSADPRGLGGRYPDLMAVF